MKATHTKGQTDFTDPVSQMKAAQEIDSWGKSVELRRSAQDKHDEAMKANLSPEKWYVLDGAVISERINDYGNFIVVACQRELTVQDKERLQLIASAPDLLAACERIIQDIDNPHDILRHHKSTVSMAAQQIAREAIAKARARGERGDGK